MPHCKYILASASPRRRELLRQIGVEFETEVPDTDECVGVMPPPETVSILARRKAEAVFSLERGLPVIGADTVVVLDGQIIGKPKDRADARRILRLLSGRTHEVYTGICIVFRTAAGGRSAVSDVCRTSVKFTELSDADIDEYADTGEPDDKAGAYGIQGAGAKFIEKIDGDYYNVVGLPLCRLNALMARAESGQD